MRIIAWTLIGGLMAFGNSLGNVTAQEIPAANTIPENGKVQVPKNQVVLVISDDRQSVTGYAEGFEVPQSLKKLEGVEPAPVVGPGPVGAVRNGNYILAFSGVLGKWDELELAPSENGTITIGAESIVVQDKAGLSYHFRANWGKWFTHEEIMRGDVKEYLAKIGLKNEVEPIRQAHLKLTYLDVVKMRELLEKKYEVEIEARRLASISAVTLAGQNLLIVGGDESLVNEIESWVTDLDKETVPFASGIRLDPQKSQPDASRGMDPRGRNPLGANLFPRARRKSQAEATKELEELKKQLVSDEEKAAELAKRLIGLPESELAANSDMLALREALLRAFRLRQEIRQAEINELKEKLATLEGELKQRSQNELEIVSRRITQLLDPKFDWEGESAEKTALQDSIAKKLSAEDRMQGIRDMTRDVNQGRGMGGNRGGADSLPRPIGQGIAATQSSALAGSNSAGSESKPEEVLIVVIDMPNSFRVVDGSLMERSTSHRQYIYVPNTGKFTVRMDRIVGYHEWEIVMDVEVLPGKKFIPNRQLAVRLSPLLKRLMSEEMSGVVLPENMGIMSVQFGDKNFADDPLNPLNFNDGAIAVVRLRAEKKATDLIKSETELHGSWYRNASRSIDGAYVQIVNEAADSKNADSLSLRIQSGLWETKFRGNTTIYSPEYDFDARPQRVLLTKLNPDGTKTNTVYERLIEIRDGDLYTAVKLKDSSSEGLVSFDDAGAIIETYQKTDVQGKE